MTIFCYTRVSTLDQNTDLQKRSLISKYPDAVYREEKKSGLAMHNRDVLNLLMDMISDSDKLVVWKLDRLARNMNDLCWIVETLNKKNAHLEIIDQNIDTGTAAGKAFLQMLGVFAEFEINLRKERQLAGIASAQAKGIHCGRKPCLSDEQIEAVRKEKAGGMTPTQLSKKYSVSRATIYNVLK